MNAIHRAVLRIFSGRHTPYVAPVLERYLCLRCHQFVTDPAHHCVDLGGEG